MIFNCLLIGSLLVLSSNFKFYFLILFMLMGWLDGLSGRLLLSVCILFLVLATNSTSEDLSYLLRCSYRN